MKNINVSFKGSTGDQLSAILSLPVIKKPKAYAIFAHCFTCSKDLKAVYHISEALTREQIAVLRFDFTGLGNSEGNFSETTFLTNIADLKIAYQWLSEHHEAPEIIIGHSLGGAAVLCSSSELENIKGVVTIGAPFEPIHVSHTFHGHIDEIKNEGKAKVDIGGRPFEISKEFLEALENHDMHKSISEIKAPLLIMHSPKDKIVEIENAAKIYKAAKHPKNFISLDDADHLLLKKEDGLYVGNMIANWAIRYLSKSKDVDHALQKGMQVITQTSDSFTTQVNACGHNFVADEPEDIGGHNLGPSPYDLLLSALGACTGMTLRMYADRKGLDLQEVYVDMKHEKKYADDASESGKKIDHVSRYITLKGNLSEDERKRLLEIADKCPVHNTLSQKVIIDTSYKD